MITITQELYNDFTAITLKGFIEKKLNAYAEANPFIYSLVKEENYYNYVNSAIEKSNKYNLSSEKEINIILLLMDYLGHDFDYDPMFTWADLNINNNEEYANIEKIKETLEGFIKNTIGESKEYYEAALKRFISLDISIFTSIKGDYEILSFLRSLYLEKFDYINEDNLLNITIPNARKKALEYGLNSEVSVFLVAYSMFMLGSFFDTDPRCKYKFGVENMFFTSEINLLNNLKDYFKNILENK